MMIEFHYFLVKGFYKLILFCSINTIPNHKVIICNHLLKVQMCFGKKCQSLFIFQFMIIFVVKTFLT